MRTNGDAQAAELVPSAPADLAQLSVLERMCIDPRVDAAKLKLLVEMQHVEQDRQAKRAFIAAFARMQPRLPDIPRRGKLMAKGGQTVQSYYELLEDIQSATKPVLAKCGFAMSYRTEWPEGLAEQPGDESGGRAGVGVRLIRIVGILAHRDGHERESTFLTSADTSGNKNKIQSEGSAVTYGRRYTARDLLNLTLVGLGSDDGGQGQPRVRAEQPSPSEGYDDWLLSMSNATEEGWAVVAKLWTHRGKDDPVSLAYRAYALTWDTNAWNGIKTRAVKADEREPGED